MKSPLQRSMDMLRAQDYLVTKTEHWNPFSKHRVDLLGCIDAIAISPTVLGVMGVNACAWSGIAGHKRKYEANPALVAWLSAGNAFEVHGWRSEEGRRDEVKVVQAYLDPITKGVCWNAREETDDNRDDVADQGEEDEGTQEEAGGGGACPVQDPA